MQETEQQGWQLPPQSTLASSPFWALSSHLAQMWAGASNAPSVQVYDAPAGSGLLPGLLHSRVQVPPDGVPGAVRHGPEQVQAGTSPMQEAAMAGVSAPAGRAGKERQGWLAQLPPVSTPVSSPFWTPSEHEGIT